MDINSYIATFGGIIVSVVLFILGYTQTVGARKERINAANADVENILLRRIVLEGYTPNLQDTSRLIESKAHFFRVKTNDLLSVSQALTIIFSRIVESDFIKPEQRNALLEKLSPVLVQQEELFKKEGEIREFVPIEKSFTPFILGISAIVLGAFTSLFLTGPEIRLDTEIMEVIFAVVAVSVSVIMFFVNILRQREAEGPLSRRSEVEEIIAIEHQVKDIILRSKHALEVPMHNQYFDFRTNINGKRTLTEVKGWKRRVPIALLKEIVSRLTIALESGEGDEAIIVTRGEIGLPREVFEDKRVKIMSLQNFQGYLRGA